MLRTFGFALLLIAASGPAVAILCSFRCAEMQSASLPLEQTASLQEAQMACCGLPQIMPAPVSVLTASQFRTVVLIQTYLTGDSPLATAPRVPSNRSLEISVASPPDLSSINLRI